MTPQRLGPGLRTLAAAVFALVAVPLSAQEPAADVLSRALEDGRFDAVIDDMVDAYVEGSPEPRWTFDEETLAELGGAQLEANKTAAGLFIFELAALYNDDSPGAAIAAGDAYHEAGLPEGARDHYAHAVRLDPENQHAREMLEELGGPAEPGPTGDQASSLVAEMEKQLEEMGDMLSPETRQRMEAQIAEIKATRAAGGAGADAERARYDRTDHRLTRLAEMREQERIRAGIAVAAEAEGPADAEPEPARAGEAAATPEKRRCNRLRARIDEEDRPRTAPAVLANLTGEYDEAPGSARRWGAIFVDNICGGTLLEAGAMRGDVQPWPLLPVSRTAFELEFPSTGDVDRWRFELGDDGAVERLVVTDADGNGYSYVRTGPVPF